MTALPPLVALSNVPLREAALAYARVGLPVFPLRGKLPLVPHGLDDASVDAAVIKRWWRRWPDANIGIPTGPPSGWVALDIDPRHGGVAAVCPPPRPVTPRASAAPFPPPSPAAPAPPQTRGWD